MREIEDFKVVTNDIEDYIGFIDASLIEPASYRCTMIDWCYSEELDSVIFLRMGVKGAGGTLLTEEAFEPYFDEFGDVMLTQVEWSDLKAESVAEDEI